MTAIPAISVKQWLPSWNRIKFDPEAGQSRPPDHFLLCSMKASHLKALTGVYRRSVKGGTPRIKDPNVQRGHEEERSRMIREFVKHGYPWCEMSEAKRKVPGADDLLKPGWLPTAILVNIVPPGAKRNGVEIPAADLIRVEEQGDHVSLRLPASFSGARWQPSAVFPLEVIDGQHRLWAFDGFDPGDSFELPVVAFNGLDRSWQAYLFWSVNITPKRINRSLAFDLYPLLRQQDWLDRFAGHSIYRQTRCQELVETLWSNPESPWHQRINMLGETKDKLGTATPMVSQAAWIRSLMASFVKQWDSSATKVGGLFGASLGKGDELQLPWNRPMQAAFLIFSGRVLQEAVRATSAPWAKHLRKIKTAGLFADDDPAFYGPFSLISTDQGIRGVLFAFNDLCYVQASALRLEDWRWENIFSGSKAARAAATEEETIRAAMKSLEKTKVASFLQGIAQSLATYDWRTSSTPDLEESQRLRQSIFRGSSGYKELRNQLLLHLVKGTVAISSAASKVRDSIGYD